ncbi:MAG TPA: hypothetical protein VK203_06400 [Nostocaceae cyanobacterium]|nr:hypothetical protein [Nostocaceae cyanobacterium]
MSNVNTVAPHKYPLWVTVLGAVVFASLLYSLIFVPKYFVASKELKIGQEAYKNRQYTEAIKNYEAVLVKIPSSQEAKISLAEVYFTKGQPADIEKGESYLKGLILDKSDVQRLAKAIPEKYKKNLDKFYII